jgi:hypothetical protein
MTSNPQVGDESGAATAPSIVARARTRHDELTLETPGNSYR